MTKKQTKSPVATAQINKGELWQIELWNLIESPSNVRETKPSEERISEMADNIHAVGLIQPLCVSQQVVNGKPTGKYFVDDGESRRRALLVLVARGLLSQDAEINCMVGDVETADIASLSANKNREDMTAHDEIMAFAKLAAAGRSAKAIAVAYGCTQAHVERRLALSNVHAEIMAEFRAGAVTLDVIQALASCNDRERQLGVWKGLHSCMRNAWNIRSRLHENEAATTDPRVKLVGLEAYEAAGGAVRKDLFNENDTYVVDVPLLEQLLQAEIDRRRSELEAEGWAWVKFAENQDEAGIYNYKKESSKREPNAKEKKLIKALEEEITKLEQLVEELENTEDQEDEWAEADNKLDTKREELEGLLESLIVIDESLKSECGAVLYKDHAEWVIVRGLRKVDRKQLQGSASNSDGEVDAEKVPESISLNLSAQQTAAMQAAILQNQDVALATLACEIAFAHCGASIECGLHVRFNNALLGAEEKSPQLPESKAFSVINEERAYWKSVLPEDNELWLEYFIGNPDQVRRMLTLGAAISTGVTRAQGSMKAQQQQMCKALNLDMTQWWEPTPDNYLRMLSKAKMVEVIKQATGVDETAAMSKLKKAEAIAYTWEKIKGTKWLPEMLKTV
jgi:ParB family transcriptional regulator, chromosome partitioning protein